MGNFHQYPWACLHQTICHIYSFCSFSLRIYLPAGVTFLESHKELKGSSSLCFADYYLLTNLACVYLSSRAFPFSAVFLVGTLCIPIFLLLFYVWLFRHPGLWRTMIKRLTKYGLVINDKQLLLKVRTSWHSDSPKCLGHLCRNLRRMSISSAFWRTTGMLSFSAQDRQHGRTVQKGHINRHLPFSTILEEFTWFILLKHFFNLPCIGKSLLY